LVRIIIIVMSRLRRRHDNFIDEFQSCLKSWNLREKLGEMAFRERRLESKREERRIEWKEEESLGIF